MLDYPLKNSENKNKEKACGQALCLVHRVSPSGFTYWFAN